MAKYQRLAVKISKWRRWRKIENRRKKSGGGINGVNWRNDMSGGGVAKYLMAAASNGSGGEKRWRGAWRKAKMAKHRNIIKRAAAKRAYRAWHARAGDLPPATTLPSCLCAYLVAVIFLLSHASCLLCLSLSASSPCHCTCHTLLTACLNTSCLLLCLPASPAPALPACLHHLLPLPALPAQHAATFVLLPACTAMASYDLLFSSSSWRKHSAHCGSIAAYEKRKSA